jgi:hypothetical protein
MSEAIHFRVFSSGIWARKDHVIFEVLAAVYMTVSVVWAMTSCSLLDSITSHPTVLRYRLKCKETMRKAICIAQTAWEMHME